MAGLSLIRRAELIKERYELPSFTAPALARCYKANGITFAKPSYQYSAKVKGLDKIKKAQEDKARELGRLIQTDQHVIYIDETTVHRWQTPNRVWCKKGVAVTIPSSRGRSFTIVGAISSRLGLVAYDVFTGGLNGERFKGFLEDIKKRISGTAYCVMDNLSAHHSKISREAFSATLRPFFLPPYSCTMNSIERLWALLKREWRKRVIHFSVAQPSDDLVIQNIREILDALDPSTI